MKKQVMTLAAMMIASNVAVAGMSQQSVKLSEDSISSIMQAGEVLASGSVNFSRGGIALSGEALKGTLKLAGAAAGSISGAAVYAADKTVDSAKSTSNKVSSAATAVGAAAVGSAESTSKNVKSAASKVSDATTQSAKSTSGSISAAAEFTVVHVKSAVSRSANSTSHIVEVTLKALGDGTVVVATFSYNSATSVGKAMISTASAIFQVGKTVVVATSDAGVALVTDSRNGTAQILDGKIQTGSSTIIASISDSSRAFGSTMVQGLQKIK
jgi:hypothetical protein